jgi:hypothetical protein
MSAHQIGEKVIIPALGSGVVVGVDRDSEEEIIQLWSGESVKTAPHHQVISQGTFVSLSLLARPTHAFSDLDGLAHLLK